MDRSARRSERGPWALPAGILLAVVVAARPAYPQEAGEVSGRHVRAGDQTAASILRLGVTASPTFRLLLDTLEHSDLIVYVETRPMRLPAQLQLAAVASGSRYLRVSVRLPGRDADLVAWLGHELQHAVELAGAPEVVDQGSLTRFYERIGSARQATATLETGKAQETWRRNPRRGQVRTLNPAYRQARRPRGREIDLAIAASAILGDAAHWTLNPQDFADLPGLRLL